MLAAASVSLAALFGPALSFANEADRNVERPRPLDSAPDPGRTAAPPFFAGLHHTAGVATLAKAIATFDGYAKGGLLDPRSTIDELRHGKLGLFHPIGTSALGAEMQRKLDEAFAVALSRLRVRRECGRMFELLGTDGSVMLATTVYLNAGAANVRDRCNQADAVAFTTVGQQATYLCPQFAQHSRWDGAIALIHESLHYSGLSERPLDPDGLSSRQINSLVRTQCSL